MSPVQSMVRRGFAVQRAMCSTCIFRDDSPLHIEKILDDISDPNGGFLAHRICHHSHDACCAAFWARYRNDFQIGRIAQRLGMVTLVDDDVLGADE